MLESWVRTKTVPVLSTPEYFIPTPNRHPSPSLHKSLHIPDASPLAQNDVSPHLMNNMYRQVIIVKYRNWCLGFRCHGNGIQKKLLTYSCRQRATSFPQDPAWLFQSPRESDNICFHTSREPRKLRFHSGGIPATESAGIPSSPSRPAL